MLFNALHYDIRALTYLESVGRICEDVGAYKGVGCSDPKRGPPIHRTSHHLDLLREKTLYVG